MLLTDQVLTESFSTYSSEVQGALVKSHVVGEGCRWKVCLEVALLKQGELRSLERI